MAVSYICDCCGHASKDMADFEVRGYVVKGTYCKKNGCFQAVDAYLAEVDAAHEKAAETFRKGVEAARKKALKAHPDMVLPDQPEAAPGG